MSGISSHRESRLIEMDGIGIYGPAIIFLLCVITGLLFIIARAVIL
jgi:hypothetical protein